MDDFLRQWQTNHVTTMAYIRGCSEVKNAHDCCSMDASCHGSADGLQGMFPLHTRSICSAMVRPLMRGILSEGEQLRFRL